MLSVAKINAAANQTASGGKGYLHYLGEPSNRQRTDFDDYARSAERDAPAPFWACKGAATLGLDAAAEAEQVELLARGFHPVTGAPLVKGAGDQHVMGLDMTFSAPKDFSAVFAGADEATRAALLEALHGSAKAALGYAEEACLTRHGHAGRVKQKAEAAVAACYTHFASRALDPQLHVHAFMFNVGKRAGVEEWSALEHRPQFERKLATGILFRVELACRLRQLGFGVQAAGPYFSIAGISEEQREALSKRSKEIAERLQAAGLDFDDSASREVAALNSRQAKAEPPLPELLERFAAQAAELGITPDAVAVMRSRNGAPSPGPPIDHQEILDELMDTQSVATAQEALCLICERGMGQLSAGECLAELRKFLAFEQVAHLGATEQLTEVFTSKATQAMEAQVSAVVAESASDRTHRASGRLVDAEFDQLEADLRRRLGAPVSLEQQRRAALHVGCHTGRHAFVEGWAGTGKTTMMRALAAAYRRAGFDVQGCCQSAAATQNLARETGIPSRTIASLLLSIREGRSSLSPKSILVLDEAGMVGSTDFAALQAHAMRVGAKLVAVGDPKQLQPISGGGMFASLMRLHGKAEISSIQRQRTDFAPLHDWLEARASAAGPLTTTQARALREVPEEQRMAAMEAVCAKDAKLSRAFARWRARFDHEWMREVVEQFAKGDAATALRAMDARGRLRLATSTDAAMEDLLSAWEADKTKLDRKAIVAGTRAEARELNARARSRLVQRGEVRDGEGVDLEILDREDQREVKRFAPGDRLVFTQNDRELGVVNGAVGVVERIESPTFEPRLFVALDDENERGEKRVAIPASFARFDLAYCLTNHKSQGRTFDAAYALANPAMADREWTYVATSRSRFATTLFVNAAALGLADPERHGTRSPRANRSQAIEALAKRMARSRAKGTSLDYLPSTTVETHLEPVNESLLRASRKLAGRLMERLRRGREMAR